MKKFIFGLIGLLSCNLAFSFEVQNIQPPYWWTGMKDHTLQLQIHGKDIKNAEFNVDYPGVTIDSVARLDGSDNWQFVYLNIAPDTKPGELKLTWKEGKETIERNYELKARKPQKGAQGFTSADVLYLIMPDRFADGNPDNNVISSMKFPADVDRNNPNIRHGGDLQGILDNIDYLDSLAITAVWVNPVQENDMPGGSYHGYATTDYYKIDPRFGSNEEYANLIEALHDRGIKTVMDMIFNHSGIAHPWIEDLPASNWLNFQDNYQQTNYRLSTINDPYVSEYDKALTSDGWFVYGMPDLNQNNPHLMKYLIQNSIWWIEDSQIDGIRMDTYAYADPDRMGEWIVAVNNEYPDFNIVGECWLGDVAGVAKWQSGSPVAQDYDTKLQTVMDFPLMTLSENLSPFKADTDPWNGLNKIYDHLALDFVYSDPNKVLRFLDNHDTDRLIKEDIDSLGSWKQAITLLLTAPGIPQIYYGTELLMSGTRQGGDGNIRKDMPGGFPSDSVSVFSRQGRTPLQNEAFDFIAGVNKWRKTNSAAANGRFKHFMPTNGLYLYQRENNDDSFIVIMNGKDTPNEVEMTRYQEIIPIGKQYRDVISGETLVLRPENDIFIFQPRETRILEPLN
ncbi:MAG: glycoside hydrolase family 13 protein [Muribaculaceae bacterium]|nr:glycoside hydrolase family 13 protein [Muribaculaceae bacterium]